MDDEEKALATALAKLGFSYDVAEALAGRGISPERAASMSLRELLDEVLCWHGIIGFTGLVLDAISNLTSVVEDR